MDQENSFSNALKNTISLVADCFALLAIGFTIFITIPWIRYTVFGGLLLFIIFWAIVKASLSRRKIKISIKDKLEMEVFFHKYEEYHDFIFNSNSEDVYVVPVNRYFDTRIDDGIIQVNSNIGRIIKSHFSNASRLRQLDNHIYATLNDLSVDYEEVSRKKGKIRKYDIGTVVEYDVQGRTIYLLALTDVDISNNAKSFCTPEMFYEAINKLIAYIDSHSEGKSVNLPLLGTHKSRLKTTQDVALNFLIDMFMMSECQLKNSIRIALSKKYNKTISLNRFNR